VDKSVSKTAAVRQTSRNLILLLNRPKIIQEYKCMNLMGFTLYKGF